MTFVVRYRSLRRADHSPGRPTDYGVSECDRGASIMRKPWPTRKQTNERINFILNEVAVMFVLCSSCRG